MLTVSVLRGYDNLVRDMFVRGVDKWMRADMPFSRIALTVDSWSFDGLVEPVRDVLKTGKALEPRVYLLHTSTFGGMITTVKAVLSRQGDGPVCSNQAPLLCKIEAETRAMGKPEGEGVTERWVTTCEISTARSNFLVERGETEIFGAGN